MRKAIWASKDDPYVPRKGADQATAKRYNPGKFCCQRVPRGGSAYLDSHFDRTSKEGDCVFRHELFECNKKGALESSQPRDIKESTINETVRKRRYIKLWYPRI
jgi:hypothetical protein